MELLSRIPIYLQKLDLDINTIHLLHGKEMQSVHKHFLLFTVGILCQVKKECLHLLMHAFF